MRQVIDLGRIEALDLGGITDVLELVAPLARAFRQPGRLRIAETGEGYGEIALRLSEQRLASDR